MESAPRPWDKGGREPFRPHLFGLKIKEGADPQPPLDSPLFFCLLLWVHFTPLVSHLITSATIDRSKEFFFFHFMAWTNQEKSLNSAKKSAFKLVKLLTLKVIGWKLSKIELPKVAWAPPYKLLNFRNFAEIYRRSLRTYHFQTWQFYKC